MMQYVMITNEYKAISDVTPESSLRCLRLSRKAGGRQCRLGSPPLGWRRLYRNPHERVRHLPRALLQRHGRLRRGIVLGICAPLGFAPGACAGCSVSAAKSAVYAPWAIWIARNTPCQLAMTDATANQLANTQRHVCTTHLRRPARAYPHGRSACSSPAPGAPTRSGAPAAPAACPLRCAARHCGKWRSTRRVEALRRGARDPGWSGHPRSLVPPAVVAGACGRAGDGSACARDRI